MGRFFYQTEEPGWTEFARARYGGEKMIKRYSSSVQRLMAAVIGVALFAMPLSVVAQTQIKLHSNKYKIADDIKVGRQAAAEVEQQMPVLHDADVNSYLSRVGQRLVNNIPSQF